MAGTDIETLPVENGLVAHLVDDGLVVVGMVIRLPGGDEIRYPAAATATRARHRQFRLRGRSQHGCRQQQRNAAGRLATAACGLPRGDAHAQGRAENQSI